MPDQQERLVAIAKTVEEARQQMHVPGCALAIVRGDKVILLKGFGERDIAHHLPVTPQTLFNIGSCTKAFTSMAAMISEQRGHLALSDHPRKYLPYFHLYDPAADARVTLRHLLDHRSGLGFHVGEVFWNSGLLTREEIIRAMGDAKPMARLGEKYIYNNNMYTAAGEVIGWAEHTTYEEAMQRLIFRPLGMTASSFTLPFRRRTADFSFGYTYDAATAQTRTTLPLPIAVDACAPAGGITTNARDMGKWLKFLVGGGISGGKRLVSAALFAEISHIQDSYTLGWVVHAAWNGKQEFWHNGSHQGYWAEMRVLPEEKLGYALLTNVGFREGEPSLPNLTRDAILSELVGKPAPAAPAAKVGSDQSKEAVASVGAYTPPISIPELMAKVIAATGGESNLRRHTSLQMTYTFTMDYQGIHGEGILSRRSPNSSSQQLTLQALNHLLGTIHIYTDGMRAGVESSPTLGMFNIGLFDGTNLDNARTAAAFPDYLDWQSRFKEIHIVRTDTVAGEPVYVVERRTEHGEPFIDYISVRSFRLLKRDDPNWGCITYSDYRQIDGVWMPFEWVQPIGGDTYATIIHVKEVQFNIPIPDAQFQSHPQP